MAEEKKNSERHYWKVKRLTKREHCCHYFLAAYSEVGRVASNVENKVTGTEVQQVLALVSSSAALYWFTVCGWGAIFGEDHLCILVNPKSWRGEKNIHIFFGSHSSHTGLCRKWWKIEKWEWTSNWIQLTFADPLCRTWPARTETWWCNRFSSGARLRWACTRRTARFPSGPCQCSS